MSERIYFVETWQHDSVTYSRGGYYLPVGEARELALASGVAVLEGDEPTRESEESIARGQVEANAARRRALLGGVDLDGMIERAASNAARRERLANDSSHENPSIDAARNSARRHRLAEVEARRLESFEDFALRNAERREALATPAPDTAARAAENAARRHAAALIELEKAEAGRNAPHELDARRERLLHIEMERQEAAVAAAEAARRAHAEAQRAEAMGDADGTN